MMGFGFANAMHWGGYMGIGIIVIIALVVYFIYKQGSFENWGGSKDNGEDAFDILAKRYASGEITEEEFERKKKVLKNY